MAIQVGDKIPEATFAVMGPEGPAKKTTDEVFKGKKVVLFAVPGAFTPSCHKNHMPSYVENFDQLKGKGVEFSGGISDHPWGRIAPFKDSEGNDLQFYAPPS